ncbi:MAG: hypothetical protein Q9222_006861 [Ikaeria aurantiellina]
MAYDAINQTGHDTPSTDADLCSSLSSHEAHGTDLQRHSPSSDMNFELPARPSMTRVSSSASIPLRHPTPDLQSLQGACLSNIERLEQSAERLSMGGSDIGEELRKIREEQRRLESRKSSLINMRNGGEGSPLVNRQYSYSQASNSIAGMNSIARSGGFSPEGYFASPRSSIRSGTWSRRNSIKARSASNASRFAQMLESKVEASPPSNETADFPPIIAPPQPRSNVLRVTNVNEPLMDSTEAPSAINPSRQPTPEPITDHPPRPSSADTYQQAQAAGLFSDFDGVHTAERQHAATPQDTPNDPGEDRLRQSSNRISSAGRPQSYLEPLPGESMIYYPAPVPMMLNLPQKLSKNPTAPKMDKRRSEMLKGLAPDSRKSAAWLPDAMEDGHDMPIEQGQPLQMHKDRRKTVGDLPPQLRASLFFDYPALQQDVEMKGGSAVETLDSILDASAFAPVSAFTDHPIAGRVGKEVYGRALNDRRSSYMPQADSDLEKRRSSINLLKKRNSSSNLLDESQKRQSSFLGLAFGKRKSSAQQLEQDTNEAAQQAGPLPNEVTHARDDGELSPEAEDEDAEFFDAQSDLDGDRADDESELIGDYNAAPTTLLAELQLRKEQQKQRNRTAATAYPDGMHSTLLELDAVAQIQKQARTKKHTHLAWEDPNAQVQGDANEDDEDVPLGVLFPGRKPNVNGHRSGYDDDIPLGLIARRDMEDNEPLSHRRARLRGEPSIRRALSPDRKNTMYTLDLSGLQNSSSNHNAAPNEEEVEGETLAQRLKRLKAKKEASSTANLNTRTISGDFASEIMSQFGGLGEQEKPAPVNNDAEPEEETLAQRRTRLQAEKSRNISGEGNDANSPIIVNKRRSMADLLQAHPTVGSRVPSNNTNEKSPLPSSATPKTPWTMQVQQRALSGETSALNGGNGIRYLGPHHGNGSGNGAGRHQRNGVLNPLMFGGKVDAGGGGMGEVRNKDMIDRWRQSVL